MTGLPQAFTAGYESIAAWAELIDRINVFPVADGDTGTNLRISLAPLLQLASGRDQVLEQLNRCAIGNSGNIAAAFFKECIQARTTADLPLRVRSGSDMARQAVADPCNGTMLSVFAALGELFASDGDIRWPAISEELRKTVLDGASRLPQLARAGVVDAGALAMFIFFDGFFRLLTGQKERSIPVHDLFAGKIRLKNDFRDNSLNSYCVDAVLDVAGGSTALHDKLSALGESVVMIPDKDRLKVHIHTADPKSLRRQLASLGKVTRFTDERIDGNRSAALSRTAATGQLHLMSDAAGSLPCELARSLGITLLDSYIIADGKPSPESLCAPEIIYARMQADNKVTTAQASAAERHQQYESTCRQYGRTLYLCTGSAFTGNYATAMAWQRRHDSAGLMTVLDSGAASGRLGLMTLLTARFAGQGASEEEIIQYAVHLINTCTEYVFINELRFLVAGGRVTRAGGFFGDLLHMKPVISPTRQGVQKIGVVRSRKGQLRFCLERLQQQFQQTEKPTLMLQYSDNREWLQSMVLPKLRQLLPAAEILFVPLSLTSGVHMGPGTWSLAHAPSS